MNIQHNVSLAPFTSLQCGGPAETLITTKSSSELLETLKKYSHENVTILGFGTNSLISDSGIPGITITTRGGATTTQDNLLIADAGVWWDDLVLLSLQQNLWGIELMSGIPSSVGGAVSGNIAAYGQQISDRLAWIEVYDKNAASTKKLTAEDITFEYRSSSLQNQPHLVIFKAAFKLSPSTTTPLNYAGALSAAQALGIDTESLPNRRTAILEARRLAGSLWDPESGTTQHTAGSFFKNPLVTNEQAKTIATYDETGKSLERLLAQNKIHGGDTRRASAAHVLLAAGFKRGQSWGAVRLHPDHILKIENTGGARAQEVYDVAHHIMQQVEERLDITLEPEVKFIGHFDSVK